VANSLATFRQEKKEIDQARSGGGQERRNRLSVPAELRRPLANPLREHGGGQARQPLDEANVMAPEVGEDLVALDEALELLATQDAEAAELVKLRFFAGLTSAQAAEALGISPPSCGPRLDLCPYHLRGGPVSLGGLLERL
jgi:DNA-directed RNA polymerase specialized sigma24 family protein